MPRPFPAPDLVIYLQAKPDILQKRVSKKGDPSETEISPDYLEAVANAYEHFFFRYSASNLLVVDTSEIDFVERNQDLQELLRRLRQPVKGTQYFLPLGQELTSAAIVAASAQALLPVPNADSAPAVKAEILAALRMTGCAAIGASGKCARVATK